MKKTALIVALGKSPEPVACSIQGHKPDFVCFYTSQESVESIPLVRQKASHQFSDHKVLVEEIEDLQHCYERALNCCRKVEEQGFKPEEIVVDYTGGTKPMTAALVLAGITRGYRFCYVGGRERDNERRGIVVEGTSELRHSENPWDVLAVSDLEQIAWAFNSQRPWPSSCWADRPPIGSWGEDRAAFELAPKSGILYDRPVDPAMRTARHPARWLCAACAESD
ncbi:TIGR02710 family CRISPR-associated protein [bacterium CPR1]|nr:TIGR02710 family CRISPR-associated protein [bacterium CPR1]